MAESSFECCCGVSESSDMISSSIIAIFIELFGDFGNLRAREIDHTRVFVMIVIESIFANFTRWMALAA
jgi:hypothetical protein